MSTNTDVTLETIKRMWREDCKINQDKLQEESLRIPELHAKYHEILCNMALLKVKCEIDLKCKKRKKNDTLRGRVENPDDIPNVIYSSRELPEVIDTDKEVSELSLKLEYYNVTIDYLKDIVKMIHSRNYHIRNVIEHQKFQAGF